MIYSTRHPKHQSSFWKFIDLECTATKMKAIGIDPKFIAYDTMGITPELIERELNELREDYNRMFPEDSE